MFSVMPADTAELQKEAYRLRYQVYCLEHNFEDPAQNPDGLERDAYDEHSVQGVLLHRATQSIVGTVRLVLHEHGSPTGCLPFHHVCQDPQAHDRKLLPLESTFELSRFAISKLVRRRIGDNGADKPSIETGMIPHMTLGLMTVALQIGIANDIEYVCAIMEPSLLRLLARFGFHFNTLGSAVWYHGWRQPVYAHVGSLLRGVRVERPEIWGIITDRGRLWPARFETAPLVERPVAAVHSFPRPLTSSRNSSILEPDSRVRFG
jgi:N-acyl amino acid synthase of PEP-CTERM/exosortase system